MKKVIVKIGNIDKRKAIAELCGAIDNATLGVDYYVDTCTWLESYTHKPSSELITARHRLHHYRRLLTNATRLLALLTND